MTDDKAIEAALKAWALARDSSWGNAMRAALAAADKVRAEGFDFVGEGVAIAMKGNQNNADDVADVLRRAFAAGLVKGEADRAALIGALEKVDDYCQDGSHLSKQILAIIAAALAAMKRKGERDAK